MAYEAFHRRSRRVLLAGENWLSIREFSESGYEDWAGKLPEIIPLRTSLMFIQASDGGALHSPRGSLPSDEEVAAFASPWVVVMHHHLYQDHGGGKPNSAPPYRPLRPQELLRFNAACLKHGIYSLAYVSPFDSARFGTGLDVAEELDRLIGNYGFRGAYVDGLYFDAGSVKLDDSRRSIDEISAIDDVVGDHQILVAHLSHGNQPAAFLPAVERMCDAVVKGEGFVPLSLDDQYLNHEIATTCWTATPVGWLYHRYWTQMKQWTTLDDLMRWQVSKGMMGVTYSHQKIADRRYSWSDGRTSYFQAWQRAIEEAENARSVPRSPVSD